MCMHMQLTVKPAYRPPASTGRVAHSFHDRSQCPTPLRGPHELAFIPSKIFIYPQFASSAPLRSDPNLEVAMKFKEGVAAQKGEPRRVPGRVYF